jgi:hypothetical protein
MGGLEAHPGLVAAAFLVVLVLGVAIWRGARRSAPAPLAEHREGERRAEALLREHVSAGQYWHLLERGYLEIPSRLHPGRRYRVPRWPGPVAVYEGERLVCELCLVTCERVPSADLFLTLKWLIEGDERLYLSLANYINPPSPRHRRWGR